LYDDLGLAGRGDIEFTPTVWHPEIGLKEIQHGKNMVDAAKATGIKHFVWS